MCAPLKIQPICYKYCSWHVLGAKNKRTLLRESNMREAAVRAQLGLATTDDELIKADNLAVMEEAMSFFYRLALKEKRRNEEADLKAIRDNLREAGILRRKSLPIGTLGFPR